MVEMRDRTRRPIIHLDLLISLGVYNKEDYLKMRIASLVVLCLALAVIPASAQTLYSNGPINGTTDAWTINFGYIVSDSFALGTASTVTGFDFGVWEFPGDVLS